MHCRRLLVAMATLSALAALLAPAANGQGASPVAAARACPAVMPANTFRPLLTSRRADLRLFSLSRKDGQSKWQSLPIQADPLDDKGILVAGADETIDQKPVSGTDRIAMRIEAFGNRFEDGMAFPCQAERLFEVQDVRSSNKFAYVAACNDPAGATKNKASERISHDVASQTIVSPIFDYAYQPNNQLVFRSLIAKDPETGKVYNAGGDADLLLHLEPKRFFTLELTNKNVNSFVEASRVGDVGLVSRINFYLKLFFFKIDLKLGTMASFFADAANLPMLIDVPVNAYERLKPGSGMVFHWLPKDAVIMQDDAGSTTPTARADVIKQGWEALAKQGQDAACRKDPCVFRLPGRVGDRPFTIEMIVPKVLVSRGYYPLWIPDMAKFKREMAWDSDEDDQAAMKDRVGFYYDASGLQKGQYQMNYWIRMADWRGSACPAPVAVRRVIEQPGTVAH